jgi:protein SCO1/2
MTIQFESIQKAFEQDQEVVLLSYSVTPWIDSTEKLKKYAEFYKVVPGKWHLLRGNKTEIYELARKSYFAEEEIGFTKDSTEFLHTEHFVLVDKTGRIRGIYNGTLALETERLIADIRILRQEI